MRGREGGAGDRVPSACGGWMGAGQEEGLERCRQRKQCVLQASGY